MLKTIIKVFASNIFSLFCAILISIIISRKLGAEGRGLYDSIMIVPTLIISFCNLGVRQSTVFITGQNIFDEGRLVATITWMAISSSVLSIFFCLIAYMIQGLLFVEAIILIMAISTIPIRLVISYYQGIFIGKKVINRYNKILNYQSVFQLLFVLFFVSFLKLKVAGAVGALVAANYIVGSYTIFAIVRTCKFRMCFDIQIAKKILSLGVIYGSVLFLAQINYRVDIIILKHYVDLATIGCYAAAVGFAELLWQIPAAISLVLFSFSSNSQKLGMTEKSIKFAKFALLSTTLIGVLVYIFAPKLLPMLYGSDFSNSAAATRALLPGIIAAVLYKVLYADIAGMGRPLLGLKIFGISAILNICLNLIMIPHFGIIGSAIASSISYCLSGVWVAIVYAKITNSSIKTFFTFTKRDLVAIKTAITRK